MACVSVIIPTFNRFPLLCRAVDSVLNQTHGDVEIIVIDDGSTDDTPILFPRQFSSIRYVKVEHSGLPAVARNAGIRLAKGELIAFLDSDDQWLPNKLSQQVSVFHKHPTVGLVCSNAFVVRQHDEKPSRPYLKDDQGHSGLVLPALLENNFIITSTAMVRRSTLEQVGLFCEDRALRAVEDYDLWLRVATQSAIVYLEALLAIYRDIPSVSIRGAIPVAQHWDSRLMVINRLRRFLRRRTSTQVVTDDTLQRQETMLRKAYTKALLSDHRYLATLPHVMTLCAHDPLAMGKAALRRIRKNSQQLLIGRRERSNAPSTASSPDKPLKLHLGCGEVYLPGYINVDFHPSRHSVQRHSKADIFTDLSQLHYPSGTIDEIRLHHVFEHFERPVALRLLIDWYGWLKEGGQLMIETPDFHRCVQEYLRTPVLGEQLKILRHLFGSHEASWAVHYDGWYRERFTHVLTALGYRNLTFTAGEWQGTYNITVIGTKGSPIVSKAEQIGRVKEILGLSLVDESPTETRMLQTWIEQFETTGVRTDAA
jgi:glycosyltransferase involved in cell wall biosynthesis/predicted SAM-dependent methyltransferase